MTKKPVAFHDLPASAYPFTIEMFTRDGRVVKVIEVSGPGVVDIPAMAAFFGPTGARVKYADGQVSEHAPWLDQ